MSRFVDPSDIIPESIELVVEEGTRPTASGGLPTTVAGNDLPGAATPRAWRARFNGDIGHLTDPLGRPRAVSLAAWKTADPDSTYIRIYFRYRQRSLIGTCLPPTP